MFLIIIMILTSLVYFSRHSKTDQSHNTTHTHTHMNLHFCFPQNARLVLGIVGEDCHDGKRIARAFESSRHVGQLARVQLQANFIAAATRRWRRRHGLLSSTVVLLKKERARERELWDV